MRENQIPGFEGLYGIHEYVNLSALNLLANPVTEEKGGDMKKEFLIVYEEQLVRLTKINKEETT